MAKIQPVTVWKDGVNRTATQLKATSGFDDLATTATFFYMLKADDTIIPAVTQEVQGPEGPETIIVTPERVIDGEILASGSIQMTGQDYDNWGTQGIGVNEEAYNFIAAYLNVTFIP